MGLKLALLLPLVQTLLLAYYPWPSPGAEWVADELLTASTDARPADILRGHSGCASAATSGLFVFLSCRMRDDGKRRSRS